MWGVREREEWYLTLSCFVLPWSGVGKNWKGACLGRKSPVLFDIVRLRCLREMLLILYFWDRFGLCWILLRPVYEALILVPACLHIHFLISEFKHVRSLFLMSKSHCSQRAYQLMCVPEKIMLRKVKSLYLAAKQISQITLELCYMIGI